MSKSNDPHERVDFTLKMFDQARELNMKCLYVDCVNQAYYDDEESPDGNIVSFYVLVDFIPRVGDVIILQDKTECKVKGVLFRIMSKEGLQMMMPTVYAIEI